MPTTHVRAVWDNLYHELMLLRERIYRDHLVFGRAADWHYLRLLAMLGTNLPIAPWLAICLDDQEFDLVCIGTVARTGLAGYVLAVREKTERLRHGQYCRIATSARILQNVSLCFRPSKSPTKLDYDCG